MFLWDDLSNQESYIAWLVELETKLKNEPLAEFKTFLEFIMHVEN